MEKENNCKIKKNILIGVIFVILVGVFIFLINLEDKNVSKVEKKKIDMFNASMLDTYKTAKTMDYEAAKQFIMSETYDAANLYGGNDSVDYSANYLLSILNTDTSGNIDDLLSKLIKETNKIVDDVLKGNIFSQEDSNVLKNSLSLKSNTVCAEEDIDNKYCVENLEYYVKMTLCEKERTHDIFSPFTVCWYW